MSRLAVIVTAGSAVATAVQATQLLHLHRRMYDEVHAVAAGMDELRRDLPAVVAAYVDGFRGGQYAADVNAAAERLDDERHGERRHGPDRRGRSGSPAQRAAERWTSGDDRRRPCPEGA